MGTATSAQVTGLSTSTTYYWQVRARNGSLFTYANGADTSYWNFTIAAATIPGAPLNLAAVAGDGQSRLSWSAPSSNGGATITMYKVYRGTTNSNASIVTTNGCASLGAVFSCTDTGLTNGQTFHYFVSAVNSAGEGPGSNTVTATPGTAAVGAPAVTTGTASGVGQYAATLNGTVNPNGAETSTGFEYGLTTAYGSTATGATLTGSASQAISAVVSGLVCNTTYHFHATATSTGGTGTGADGTFRTSACSGSAMPHSYFDVTGATAQAHDLGVGPDGAVYVLYVLSGGGLAMLKSTDGGVSWGPPTSVTTGTVYNSWSRLSVDPSGNIHGSSLFGVGKA